MFSIFLTYYFNTICIQDLHIHDICCSKQISNLFNKSFFFSPLITHIPDVAKTYT